jgi:hypothetical protein
MVFNNRKKLLNVLLILVKLKYSIIININDTTPAIKKDRYDYENWVPKDKKIFIPWSKLPIELKIMYACVVVGACIGLIGNISRCFMVGVMK